MRALLISLFAATALAAAVVWAPAPGGWLEDDPPADSAPPPAPAAPAAPQSIQASAATAHIQFAAATGFAGDAGAGAPPGAAGATPPRPPPGPPVLVGLIDGSPRRYAYVLANGETTRAGLWDKVGIWRVTAIGPHGVTLSAGRRTLQLALYGPRPEQAPPPPATPAAAVAAPASPTPSPPPAQVAAAPAPPRPRGLEPASAPGPHRPHVHYWVGPADQAPPGYIVLPPGERPPTE